MTGSNLAMRAPPGGRLGMAAGVLIALALAIVLAAVVRFGSKPERAPPPEPATLAELPARPAEIEARGEEARTLVRPDAARRLNAKVPFAQGPLDAARPFAFNASAEDRASALECLATAVLYEAGDDRVGQEAVAQVVLNRVRHPAFPRTVCGVVYQGSERETGCQFSFTCDGSLSRRMPDAAWARARVVAARALDGEVFETVGLATHFHTDWVYPYWSPELRKLARVGTHLFFRWPGPWGGPGAFRREYLGGEPRRGSGIVPLVAQSSELAAPPPAPGGLPALQPDVPDALKAVPLYGNRLELVHPSGREFGLVATPGVSASDLVMAALALCVEPGACTINAWGHEDDIPWRYPLPPGAEDTVVFRFTRDDSPEGFTVRFDCARFPNGNAALCL